MAPKPVTLSDLESHCLLFKTSLTPIRPEIWKVLTTIVYTELECGPMPNVMVALPNIGGTLG